MKGYNTLLGSHYDHYYIEYDAYDVNPIPENTFAIDSSKLMCFFPNNSQCLVFFPFLKYFENVLFG